MNRVEHIGNATLYLGDCREILPTLGRFDAAVTDPPYGVRDDEEWDIKPDAEMAHFSMEWATAVSRIADEVVSFDSGYTPLRRVLEMLWPRVRVLIWDKPMGSQYAGASERGMWFAHEPIFHCYRPSLEKSLDVGSIIKAAREAGGLSRGGVDMAVRGKKTGLCFRWEEGACLPTDEQVTRLQAILALGEDFASALAAARGQTTDTAARHRDVLSHRTVSGAVHPCEKPLTLMRELLSAAAPTAQTILDPFMGSAVTGIAAVTMDRQFVGIEQSEKYFDLACRRIDQAQRQFTLAV